MSATLLLYGPTLLAWLAVAYKFPAYRRRRRAPDIRAFWLTLLALALAQTLLLPPIYVALDRLAGIPNLARLLSNGGGVIGCWILLAYLIQLNYPAAEARPRLRRAALALGGALAAMVVLFALAPVRVEDIEFMRRYGDAPFVAEYRLVYLLAIGGAFAVGARLLSRYAGVAGRPLLRDGLRLMALGGAVGLGYVVHEAARVVAERADRPFPVPHPELVTAALGATAAALTVVGATLPACGPRVGLPALYERLAAYRASRDLAPLWQALYAAVPMIALSPPPSWLAEHLSPRDLPFRLYRRVIEIRDGELALRPYIPPGLVEAARGLASAAGVADDDVSAIAEAAGIAAALCARSRGQMPAETATIPLDPGAADLAGEVAILRRVARHYRHSPTVRMVLATLDTEPATGAGHAESKAGLR
ncbi:MAG TPA: MAB_1171c family putative transporter [Thermomicrobiales bacterium]|nr:MAB_1171c family putative transporter [Thermomicrobiales bacterium]